MSGLIERLIVIQLLLTVLALFWAAPNADLGDPMVFLNCGEQYVVEGDAYLVVSNGVVGGSSFYFVTYEQAYGWVAYYFVPKHAYVSMYNFSGGSAGSGLWFLSPDENDLTDYRDSINDWAPDRTFSREETFTVTSAYC